MHHSVATPKSHTCRPLTSRLPKPAVRHGMAARQGMRVMHQRAHGLLPAGTHGDDARARARGAHARHHRFNCWGSKREGTITY